MNGIKLIERGHGSDLLKKRCREIGVPVQIIRNLVAAELEQVGKLRKRGLAERFDEILGELVDAEGEGPKGVSEIDSAA